MITQINEFLNSVAIGCDVGNQFGKKINNIGGVSNNNVREWLKPVQFDKFVFKQALEMSLKEYKDHVRNNIANAIGVGLAYEAVFVAFCLSCAGRSEYATAYALAASIYENVFLAGFKPERKPMLAIVSKLEIPNYSSKNLTTSQLIQYFIDTTEELGFDLSQNNAQLTKYQLAYHYLQCCALNFARRAKQKNSEVTLPSVVEELQAPLAAYIPLIDLTRKISKGNPDWDTETPIEVINMMATDPEAHELFQQSTLRKFLNEVYPTYIRLCKMTKLSLRVKAAVTEDEV